MIRPFLIASLIGATLALPTAAQTLDVSRITIEPVGFPTREPMLASGEVDAVTGFSFTSYLNTVRLGVDPSDISVMLMADYGVELYGNVIIVNTDWAPSTPRPSPASCAPWRGA